MRLFSSYAGITRIRFKGYILSRSSPNGKSAAPLTGNANTLNLKMQIV